MAAAAMETGAGVTAAPSGPAGTAHSRYALEVRGGFWSGAPLDRRNPLTMEFSNRVRAAGVSREEIKLMVLELGIRTPDYVKAPCITAGYELFEWVRMDWAGPHWARNPAAHQKGVEAARTKASALPSGQTLPLAPSGGPPPGYAPWRRSGACNPSQSTEETGYRWRQWRGSRNERRLPRGTGGPRWMPPGGGRGWQPSTTTGLWSPSRRSPAAPPPARLPGRHGVAGGGGGQAASKRRPRPR